MGDKVFLTACYYSGYSGLKGLPMAVMMRQLESETFDLNLVSPSLLFLCENAHYVSHHVIPVRFQFHQVHK